MRVVWMVLLSLYLMVSTGFAADPGYGAKGALQAANPTVQEMLNYSMQDEYLARAEYNVVLDKFGKVRPFSNIVRSEEQHIALLKPLFTDRGWDVPGDESAAQIEVPETGAVALQLGRQIELDNIAMYEHFLRQPNLPEDVKSVFERLVAASRRHLQAYNK